METKSLAGSYIYTNNPNNNQQQSQQHFSTYKKLIARASKHPYYQYALATFICLFWLLITYNAMIGAFVFMNPLFLCSDGAAQKEYTEKQACRNIQKCWIKNDFTAVNKNSLFCQKQNIRSTIQSIFALGLTIGMTLMPILSDMIGRRKVIILLFLTGVLAYGTLYYSIQYNIQVGMIIGSTLAGVFGAGITALGFILTCQFCTQKMIQSCLLIYCTFWGIAEMTFYLLYFYMPDWNKYLLFMLFIPTCVLLILAIFFKIQSPVYAIFLKKDTELAHKIFNKLSSYNKIDNEQLSQIKNQASQLIQSIKLKSEQNKKSKSQLLETLGKIAFVRSNLVTCLCLMMILVSFNFFYYGMQGSMERTGYNFGTSMLLVGFSQFVSYLSASYLTKFMKRKKGIIISVSLACAAGLLFMLEQVKESQLLQTILAVVLRILSVYAYCFILLLQSELLGMDIRATAIALIAGIAQISRIAVPYVINFFNDLGIHIIIVTSILFMVFGIFPVLPLNQSYTQQQNLVKESIQNSKPILDEESQRKNVVNVSKYTTNTKNQYMQFNDQHN